jgi:hypothetical protein
MWVCGKSSWAHPRIVPTRPHPANTQACGIETIQKIEACADELCKMAAEAVAVKKVERFKAADLVLPQVCPRIFLC